MCNQHWVQRESHLVYESKLDSFLSEVKFQLEFQTTQATKKFLILINKFVQRCLLTTSFDDYLT